MSLFVDTSVWYAVADTSDGANRRAKLLLETTEPLVTSDHVLVETWGLIHSRSDAGTAERFWDGIRGGGISIEPTTAADLESAWAIGQAFSDQGFSIVDRTSFAVMERLGIHQVASFDSAFAIYRFGARRDRAFNVLN